MTIKQLAEIIMEAGINELSAFKMAEGIFSSIKEELPKQLSTKEDVEKVRTELECLRGAMKNDLATVKIELVDRISAAKSSMTLWMGSCTAFLTLVMALFKFIK